MSTRAELFRGVVHAWGGILSGHHPNLSIEITRECPLRCPGCYAFGDAHLGGDVTPRGLSDYKGNELVQRFLALVDQMRPLHVSIVGGEPLVRHRELATILPALAARRIHAQLVTSAVRPIPRDWSALPGLQVVVSVDGLPPEHDVRRSPATSAVSTPTSASATLDAIARHRLIGVIPVGRIFEASLRAGNAVAQHRRRRARPGAPASAVNA
jgi:MoaA/NifB/PqqE/SkfB family radical SAM enzyme